MSVIACGNIQFFFGFFPFSFLKVENCNQSAELVPATKKKRNAKLIREKRKGPSADHDAVCVDAALGCNRN